jgi:hypothetical protein
VLTKQRASVRIYEILERRTAMNFNALGLIYGLQQYMHMNDVDVYRRMCKNPKCKEE